MMLGKWKPFCTLEARYHFYHVIMKTVANRRPDESACDMESFILRRSSGFLVREVDSLVLLFAQYSIVAFVGESMNNEHPCHRFYD
jgi:hypothetical protein